MPARRGQPKIATESRGPGGPFAGTVINVKDYGATGNGTDDTAALEAAINASQQGDALYFPCGTYIVSRSLRPKDQQRYFSLSGGARIKADRMGFPIFIISSGPIEFHHLILDGARRETPNPPDFAPAIWRRADVSGAVDIVVLACRIQNIHGDGIHIAGGPGLDRGSDRVIIRDSVVENCAMNGVGIGRVDHVRVESSRFERCYGGIKMLDCHDVVVHAVTANANRRHGIVFHFSHRFHVDSCVASGNGFAEDRGWGIAAGGEPGDLDPNSDFTITNNICEDNADGGITLDPTVVPKPGEPEIIWPQRATVSGNVCRNAKLHHGIQLTHARGVAVTGNVCANNQHGSGIQLLSSSHVLVQGNACFGNRNGIGLFSNKDVTDPGHHLIGVNLLYGNTQADIRHQEEGVGQPLNNVRIHGLHGEMLPEGSVKAEPGTLYERHENNQGALYVKEEGSGTTGWARVAVSP